MLKTHKKTIDRQVTGAAQSVVNAAKMREALENCTDLISNVMTGKLSMGPVETIEEIDGIISKALATPPRNCDAIPSKDLVDEFCRSLGYDVMDERNGYADGQYRFMQEHWFEFSKWITMPYKQAKGGDDGSK